MLLGRRWCTISRSRLPGGANDVSLRQAQENFIKFGACSEFCIDSVRKPSQNDIKDPNWKPL